MEEENLGLTFGDILKVLGKKIWWIIGSVAVGILVLVLCMQLWYNKSREYYVINYEIVYPGSGSSTYPDGSAFLISDSISKEALESIKSSDERFSDIDVDKIVFNDKIKVNVNETSGSANKTYEISGYADVFSSYEQAVKFLRAVASYPINKVNSLAENKDYRPYVAVYDNAKTYEQKIEALNSQKNYLLSEYNKLAATDKSVESKIAALDNLFTSDDRETVQTTISANYYVLNTELYLKDAENKIIAIDKQIADNNVIIGMLREERKSVLGEAPSDPTQDVLNNAYDTEIAKLLSENGRLTNTKQTIEKTKTEIAKYTDQTNAAYNEKREFDALLESYRTQLTDATDTLKEETVKIYSNNSKVIFASNTVSVQGGMGTITSALLGAVAGLLISAVVILIIDLPKYKKRKLAEFEANAEGGSENVQPAAEAEEQKHASEEQKPAEETAQEKLADEDKK